MDVYEYNKISANTCKIYTFLFILLSMKSILRKRWKRFSKNIYVTRGDVQSALAKYEGE